MPVRTFRNLAEEMPTGNQTTSYFCICIEIAGSGRPEVKSRQRASSPASRSFSTLLCKILNTSVSCLARSHGASGMLFHE